MLLKEIGLQSYSDANNRRHHFEFAAAPAGPATAPGTGDRMHLTPLEDCGNYLFTEPIKDVHGLTVCFYNPDHILRFPPDCMYGVLASASDPDTFLTFTYLDPSGLLNLAVGDRIFIKGFAVTGYPVLNTYITRPEGHLVGLADFSSVLTTSGRTVIFRLNPDVDMGGLTPAFLAGAPVPSTQRIDICIAKNRLRIPLRFRRIVDRLTNYITPT